MKTFLLFRNDIGVKSEPTKSTGPMTLSMAFNIINLALNVPSNYSVRWVYHKIPENYKMSIAVVDSGGNLIAFARKDDCPIGWIDVAIKKAKTSLYFNGRSEMFDFLVKPGSPYYSLLNSNGGLITFPGGYPIRSQVNGYRKLVGGIGIAGNDERIDRSLARYVLGCKHGERC